MPTRNVCRFARWPIALTALLSATVAAAQAGDPPVITQHPASQMVCEGANATFTVVASGEGLSYQWRKDDESIAGATSDTLMLDATTPADNGDYDCVVSNAYGEATSNAATLIVDPGPQIAEHPASAEVCEGDPVTLSVVVSNLATPWEDTVGSTANSGSGARMRANYYQVYSATTLTRIEQHLAISTSGQLVFFVYESDDLSGPYVLIAEDIVPDSGTGTGYFSSGALTVPLAVDKYYIIGGAWPDDHTYYWDSSHPNPVAFGQSLNGFAYAWQYPLPDPPPTPSNSFAYMQRLSTSDLAMTYQWRKGGQELPGAGGPQYTIDAMTAADADDYDVLVANACGNAVSNTATLTLGLGLTITEDPNDQVACVGVAVTFTVVASGPNLSYQWRKDGEDIPDATGDTHAIEAVTLEDAGEYDAVVTNPCDTLTSSAATLTVADGVPTITEHPNDQSACEGYAVTLTVVAAGTGLEYQWRKDGVDLPNATDAAYVIHLADPNDAGSYDVVVSNVCGSATSDAALLDVDEAMSIVEQPVGGLICQGDAYTLSFVAAGTGLGYQWRKESENIPDATDTTYVIDPATLDDSGSYDVVVTNNCGEIISAAAAVTVMSGPVITEHPVGQWLEVGDELTLTVELDLASFPDDVDPVGTSANSSSGADKIRGNSYEVWQSTTLTRIEHYLNITTSGALVFFVYEAEVSEQGPYTLMLEDTLSDSGTGLGFYASHPLEATLEAGKYYIIGTAWRGSHGYYWDDGPHPQPTAFGQSVHGYATTYQAQLPYDPVPTSPNVYYQRLTTVDRVAWYQWRQDGNDIPGATVDTYTVPAVRFADAGLYDVVATNECGSVTTDAARVRVVARQAPPLPYRPPTSAQRPTGSQPRVPDP